MIPRKDSVFFKTSPALRGLYLTGMPKSVLNSTRTQFNFQGLKVNSRVLSTTEQNKKFQEFTEVEPTGQSITVFCSSPTDQDALEASGFLLKHYHKKFGLEFEYCSPHEFPPYKTEKVQGLYCLTGIHESDDQIVHQVRRWCRQPHGAPVWIHLVSKDPFVWMTDRLGIKPDFLFRLTSTGSSVG